MRQHFNWRCEAQIERSRARAFPTILHVRPAKTQISLYISLRCMSEDALDPWLSTEHPAKSLIRLRECAG